MKHKKLPIIRSYVFWGIIGFPRILWKISWIFGTFENPEDAPPMTKDVEVLDFAPSARQWYFAQSLLEIFLIIRDRAEPLETVSYFRTLKK